MPTYEPRPRLPPLTADERAVAEWVAARAAALDSTEPLFDWRYNAQGRKPLAEIIADTPDDYRMNFNIPIEEMRILRLTAERRSTTPLVYARRAIGTILVACDDVAHEDLSYFLRGGIVGPFRG